MMKISGLVAVTSKTGFGTLNKRLATGLWWVLAGVLAGCDPSSKPASMPQPEVSVPAVETTGSQLQQQLQQLAHHSFEQAEQQTDALKDSISLLLDNPDPFTLQAAQEQWQQAYLAYCRTLMFSYLPTQDPAEWTKEGINRHRLMHQVESWPIEGGYIDYVEGYPLTGIVNDLSLQLNRENLIAQHRFAAPESASLGFHVVEFLLWGEDGQRPASDYLKGKETGAKDQVDLHVKEDGLPTPLSGQNPQRRRQYLKLVTNILSDDVERMARRWQPVNGYYASLVAESSPAQVLSAGLQASDKLLDSVGKQLSAADENAGSHTEPLFVQARLMSMKTWLLGSSPIEEESESPEKASTNLTGGYGTRAAMTGALKIVFPPQSELIHNWQIAFSALETSLTGQKNEQGPIDDRPQQPVTENNPVDAQTSTSTPSQPAYSHGLAQLESLLQTTKEAMPLK
jgi:putative iron-regulated protein